MDESEWFLESTQLCGWNAPFPDISYAVSLVSFKFLLKCHLISKAFPILLKIATCPPTPTPATNSLPPFSLGPMQNTVQSWGQQAQNPQLGPVPYTVTTYYILRLPCLFTFLSESRGFCLVISKCLKQCWPHSRCNKYLCMNNLFI